MHSNGDIQEGLSLIVAGGLLSSCHVGLLFHFDPCGNSTLVVMCMGTFFLTVMSGAHSYLPVGGVSTLVVAVVLHCKCNAREGGEPL